MINRYIPCAFVNDVPTKIGPAVSYNVTKGSDEKGEYLKVTAYKVHYCRHPHAPEEAILTVDKSVLIGVYRPGEIAYAAASMLHQALQNFEDINDRLSKSHDNDQKNRATA